MARDLGSRNSVNPSHSAPPAPAKLCWVGGWVFAAAFGSTWACATGVDVGTAELAEICEGDEQFVICDGAASGNGGSGGAGGAGPTGSAGASNNPGGSSGSSGAFSGTGGSTGSSGSTGTSGSTGSSGSTGASGSAGTGNQPQQPLAQGQCMPAAEDDVVIVYTDDGNGAATNQVQMILRVQNRGASFNLTDLTIRYWFTDDDAGNFTSNVDYASQGGGMDLTTSVQVAFAEANGSNYAAISFTGGNTVESNGTVEQIKLRLHTENYANIDQSNDFSFSLNGTDIENRNITPYINGVQVGGCVPVP